MGGRLEPRARPGASAYPKPEGWDPVHPTPRICIYCYAPAKQVYVWKWGVDWVCDSHLTIAKKAIGYDGIFRSQAQGEAHREFNQRAADAKKRK